MLGTATKLQTARKIELSGDVNGTADFDGSKNITIKTTQNNISIIKGELTTTDGEASTYIDYPEGFTSENTVIISVSFNNEDKGYAVGYYPRSTGFLVGALGYYCKLNSDKIYLQVCNPTEGAHDSGNKSYKYMLVLMKIS